MAKMQIDIIGKDKTQKAFNSLQNNVSKTQKSFFTLKNAIIAVASSVVIRQLLDLTNEYQNLQNRLKLVTNSTKELTAVQEELFQISRRTRGGFSETVELYQKLALQAQNLGLRNTELLEITENVNKVIGIAGVNSIQASAGILQLSQAFASGRLQGDEFRSISENIPPLLDIFAKELGVTRGELKKLGSEGKITSDVIATALLKETDNINKKFEQLSPTIGQATTRIGNSFLNLVGKFNEVTGTADTLSSAIIGVSDALDNLTQGNGKLEQFLAGLALSMGIAVDLEELNKQLNETYNIVNRGGGQDLAETESLDVLYKTAEKLKDEKKEREKIQEIIIGQCKVEDSLQEEILNKIIKQNAQFSLASEIFEVMTSTISSLSRGIARSIVLGEDMAETFKTIARNLLIEIIAKTIERIALLFIEKLIIEKIFKKQNDQLQKEKQITKEKQKQVALQMILVALGGGGGGGGLFGFAQGGAVSKDKPILVGENGPEIFRPNSTGQIEQNARGFGMGGASTVNINVSATDVKGVKELLIDNRSTIVNAVNIALNEKGKEALV
jgi:tape measure domain-containing protein